MHKNTPTLLTSIMNCELRRLLPRWRVGLFYLRTRVKLRPLQIQPGMGDRFVVPRFGNESICDPLRRRWLPQRPQPR
jgi:hypothetical protein